MTDPLGLTWKVSQPSVSDMTHIALGFFERRTHWRAA